MSIGDDRVMTSRFKVINFGHFILCGYVYLFLDPDEDLALAIKYVIIILANNIHKRYGHHKYEI